MPTRLRSPLSRLTFVSALMFALAFALAGCGSSGASSASGVTIKNLAFTTTPVKSGSTVTVTNNDTVTHTVTSDDAKSFDVTVNAGATATFAAPAAGTYKFHCRIHSQMHGTLTVT
jgi:plastocyanin